MNITTLNTIGLDGVIIKKGGGGTSVASLMTEVTWQELKDLRDSGKLVAGMKYRMIDYDTYASLGGTQSAMHPFDLILTALDEKTLDEKCSAIQSARDVDGYFANSNLTTWEVYYCLDNDISRFAAAAVGGKYITASFDGEVIEGKYFGKYTVEGIEYEGWSATFMGLLELILLTETLTPSLGDIVKVTYSGGSTIIGESTFLSYEEKMAGKGFIYRLVDEAHNDIPYDFKNIMFSRMLTDGKLNTESGTSTFCYTFSSIAEDYTISDHSLMPKDKCVRNTFGEGYDVVFLNGYDDVCKYNIITYANNVTFGSDCSNNKLHQCLMSFFGDNFSSNKADSVIVSCNLGDDFYENIIEGTFSSNTIGEYCTKNKFTRFTSNTMGGNIWECEFTGVSNCTIESSATGYSVARNYHISNLPQDTSVLLKDRNYPTFITINKNNEVKEFTIDDIINI